MSDDALQVATYLAFEEASLFTYECPNCGYETLDESDGEYLLTMAGNYYNPPEHDWYCDDCIAFFDSQEEAFWESVADRG